MHTLIATRKRTPLDGMPVDAFQAFAAFLRGAAPRWLNGNRSLSRLMSRRAGQQQAARGRRRGLRHVGAPAPSITADLRGRR
ncbi:MAG: hypothetical protein IPP44_13750 [Ideonella sp.]|nr:hypothetical protein [Ideonella sp.]